MTLKKMEQLIDKLRTQTEQDKIHWEEGAQSESFYTSLPNTSVRIIFQPRADTYQLEIIDSTGRVIERVEPTDFDLPAVMFDGMKELHNAARRQVYKVEETVDDILSKLG